MSQQMLCDSIEQPGSGFGFKHGIGQRVRIAWFAQPAISADRLDQPGVTRCNDCAATG